MARNGVNNYFEMMRDMANCANDAATKLTTALQNFVPTQIDEIMREMHRIEHHGDDLKHQLVEKLVKEFITPIEREDIMALVEQIDDVIDAIEDVVIKLYMFNTQTIRPNAVTFAETVCLCTRELVSVFDEFSDFKKSKKLSASIIEINRLEEAGDTLYVDSVRELYEKRTDAIDIATWTEIYGRLENCCDNCEHTADLVANVIMKNT